MRGSEGRVEIRVPSLGESSPGIRAFRAGHEENLLEALISRQEMTRAAESATCRCPGRRIIGALRTDHEQSGTQMAAPRRSLTRPPSTREFSNTGNSQFTYSVLDQWAIQPQITGPQPEEV